MATPEAKQANLFAHSLAQEQLFVAWHAGAALLDSTQLMVHVGGKALRPGPQSPGARGFMMDPSAILWRRERGIAAGAAGAQERSRAGSGTRLRAEHSSPTTVVVVAANRGGGRGYFVRAGGTSGPWATRGRTGMTRPR